MCQKTIPFLPIYYGMKTLMLVVMVLAFNLAQADEGQKASVALPQYDDVAYYPPSAWGQPPEKVTKDLVCLQYPKVCETDKEETADTQANQ